MIIPTLNIGLEDHLIEHDLHNGIGGRKSASARPLSQRHPSKLPTIRSQNILYNEPKTAFFGIDNGIGDE